MAHNPMLIRCLANSGTCSCFPLTLTATWSLLRRGITSCDGVGLGSQQQRCLSSDSTSSSSPKNEVTSSSTSASPLHALGQSIALQTVSDPAISLGQSMLSVERVGASGKQRTWQWYDLTDEKEERQRAKLRKYPDAGHVVALNIPQSLKKMNRVLRVVRRLSYSEAMHQLYPLPHKAARFIKESLEKAREDAKRKGLKVEALYIDTIYATKGQHEKRVKFMGKGNVGLRVHRRSHLKVVLREDVNYKSWKTELLPPKQSTWKTRPKSFDYRAEV